MFRSCKVWNSISVEYAIETHNLETRSVTTKWIQISILSFGSTHVNKFPVLDFRHQTQHLKIQESEGSIVYKDAGCYFGKYHEYLFLMQRDPFLSTVYRINTGLKEPQNMLKMSE